jgi:hypothetical protein
MSRQGPGAVIALFITALGASQILQASETPWKQPTVYVGKSQFISKSMEQDFIPDGNLEKPVWRAAHWVKVDHDPFKPAAYPQSATEIASLWTPRYVYFAYRCTYTSLNLYEVKDPDKDFWTLWDRDVVEVFLNPEPDRMKHYYEFEVAPNNLWIDLEIDLDKTPFNDAGWNSGFDHATHIDAAKHVWTCEMRIPVAGLNGAKPLVPGAEWRVNFFRADGLGDDAHRRFLSWSPVYNKTDSFHAPWSFGVIRFLRSGHQ